MAGENFYAELGKVLGVDIYAGINQIGRNTFADSWLSGLNGLEGYYDRRAVQDAVGLLGENSSSQWLQRLQMSTENAAKLYGYIANPDSMTEQIKRYGAANGLTKVDTVSKYYGGGYGYDISTGEYYDIQGQRRKDVNLSSTLQQVFTASDLMKQYQESIMTNLAFQQEQENKFVTQIRQITQNATLAKSQADQAAAYAQMEASRKAAEAEMNKKAAEQTKLLEQQRWEQESRYEAARKNQQVQMEVQTRELNQAALATALSNASTTQQEQAIAVANANAEQAQQVRGGEAEVIGIGDGNKQQTASTRTERWQARRKPAPGGGGARV